MGAELDLDGAYRRFGEAVYRRARRLLRDDALARDVVQETFLRAHKYGAGFRGGSVLAWLFTIADRVAWDLGRRRGAVLADVDDAAADALVALDDEHAALATRPPSAEALAVRDDLVTRVLGGVDDETRAILVHRYVDELDTADVALRLNTSERTVRRRLEQFFSRARARGERLGVG